MKCDICGKESKAWHYVVCKKCVEKISKMEQELYKLDEKFLQLRAKKNA